jgi:hypothetical protein
MKKLMALALVAMFLIVPLAHAGSDKAGPYGPAPNAGDGIPDGSGFDGPNGPNAESPNDSKGPAPNAGDGIPDGSGFDPLTGELDGGLIF